MTKVQGLYQIRAMKSYMSTDKQRISARLLTITVAWSTIVTAIDGQNEKFGSGVKITVLFEVTVYETAVG